MTVNLTKGCFHKTPIHSKESKVNELEVYTGAKKDWHPYYINTIEMR